MAVFIFSKGSVIRNMLCPSIAGILLLIQEPQSLRPGVLREKFKTRVEESMEKPTTAPPSPKKGGSQKANPGAEAGDPRRREEGPEGEQAAGGAMTGAWTSLSRGGPWPELDRPVAELSHTEQEGRPRRREPRLRLSGSPSRGGGDVNGRGACCAPGME